jgi:hypothetical protein
MLTEEWAREHFKIGFPFLKVMNPDHPIHEQIVDDNRKNRYWSTPYKYGNLSVFACNEWHENNRVLFDKWLNEVPSHVLRKKEEYCKDDIVRLVISDYKTKKQR